mgnify:CR=1 FL=1
MAQTENQQDTESKRLAAQNKAAIYEKFSAAHEKAISLIESYITKGYADTLARLLVYIGSERAEQTLAELPEAVQKSVRTCYDALLSACKKNTDADIICEAGPVLKKAGFYGKAMADAVMNELGEMLPPISEELDALFKIDPLIAMNIEAGMFSFTDIVELDDRSIQKVLREVDQQDLAMALKNVEAEVQDKIFRNMSKRAANMLKEDIEFMGPVRLVDVYDAQIKIMKIVRQLEENGEIVFPSAGAGAVVY